MVSFSDASIARSFCRSLAVAEGFGGSFLPVGLNGQ